MKSKYCVIDFEFSGVSESYLNLICCSLQVDDSEVEEFWLFNSRESKQLLINRLSVLCKESYIFISHGVSAEASAFISLGLNPTDFKWIDTFIEFRCISNSNHEVQYGKHLVGGKVKTLYPPKPKYQQTEEDKLRPSGKINHSYAQLVYKFLGEIVDTEHKEEMRRICISADPKEVEENKGDIQAYCSSDIKYLRPCLKEIVKEYSKLLHSKDLVNLKSYMLNRGATMAQTARMERNGYPIDYNSTRYFAYAIPDIINECCADINSQFPEMGVFSFSNLSGKYVRKEKPIREWISNSPHANGWLLTEKGRVSLSLDAFSAHFPYRHSYPRDNFGAQMVRHLKLKQSLNGFSNAKGKRSFWDSVGSDGRVRSYLNPYGSLSSRYQPPSTGFLFLKPAWMRSLCVPPKGKMIVGIDYKSEEFLISGLWAKDLTMINAYKSGDVYLAFAKESGMVPQDATKATHPIERQSAKSAVLGISYLMTKVGLANSMSRELGRDVEQEEAQEFIDAFNNTFHVHDKAVVEALEDYYQGTKYSILPDGWVLFGDNDNFRSVANFPKQGMGACILRKAVEMAHEAGLKPVVVLHDALYFEVDLDDWSAVQSCMIVMREAFVHYYKGTDMEQYAEYIMLDTEIWSPELEEGTGKIKTPWGEEKFSMEKYHLDDRAQDEYEKFSKYFQKPDYLRYL